MDGEKNEFDCRSKPNQKQIVHLDYQNSNASDIIDILLSQMLVAC